MLHQRTHIHIDGKVHKIVEIAAQDGARHTHRVHLACGLTVDVDHEGAKHAAVALEHRAAQADAAARKDHGHVKAYREHAEYAEAAAQKHRDDVSDPKGRWRTHTTAAATCAECARVEAGGERSDFEPGFNPPVKPTEK
jgi:hypothetical protein